MSGHITKQHTRHARIETVVPAVFGWQTFPAAFLSVLLVGLVGLAGEWIAHQLEYLIEYGGRFGAVMAATPHHYYMPAVGTVLALMVGVILFGAGCSLRHSRHARRALLLDLPRRLAAALPAFTLDVSFRAVGRTALLLATGQLGLYLVQENLESAAVSGDWPGFLVVFGRQHATAVPLHLAVAGVASLLLWMLSSISRHARSALQVARVLAAMVARRRSAPRRLRTHACHIPDLRPVSGSLGLRSPPLAV